MKHTHRIYTRIGFLFAGTGVILGAFGAHFLKERMGDSEMETFDTGVFYQLIHALAIIFLSLSHRRFEVNKLKLALNLFVGGIILFSGSLYLLATRNIWGDDSYRIIGAITPLGGISFISAWLLLLFKGFKKEVVQEPIKGTDGESKSGSRKRHRRRRSTNSENPEAVVSEN